MYKKQQRKTHTERFWATFILGVMILFTLFLVSFASAITWDNVAYYDFDEDSGTNLTDQASDNLYGTTSNMEDADWITGLLGNALLFDGVDESVNLQDASQYNFSQLDEGSVSVWVNLSADLNTTIQGTIYNLDGLDAYIINSEWRFSFHDNESIDYRLTFPIDGGGLGAWTHLVNTYDINGNHSIYVNGVLVNTTEMNGNVQKDYGGTYLDIGEYQNIRFWNGSIDEMGIWDRTLSAAEVSELYNSGSGLAYVRAGIPNINLISPSDNAILSDVGTNFTVNYTITGANLWNWTNATYYIWDSTGLFNNSVTVEISGTTNTTTEYIDDFVLGDYEWNIYACWKNATFSNCSFAESNYSFFVGASIINEEYNNITYETSYETFLANTTLIAGANLYDAQLYYNGTAHEGTIVSSGSNNFLLTNAFDVLSSPSNYTWYWRLTYKKPDGSFVFQNLDTNSQEVLEISLFTSGCSIGTNTTLNFSSYDEENLSQINDFSFYGTFEYWLGSGDVKKNFSVSNSSVGNSLFFCISPNNLTYYSDAQIQYEKTGYVKRSYYLINASLTNTTNNIGLYLLNSTQSTSFIINIIDDVQFAVVDAYIYIQRYYPGTGVFHTVEMAETDSSGNTIGHFEAETEDYKIIVIKDGVVLYESDSQKVFCGETPCTLSFQTEAPAPTTWTDIGDLANLIWSLTYDESTKIWTYTYVDTSGTTNYGRLLVYIEDGNSRTIICNKTDTSSAATLTCNVTDYDGTIYAEVYISRIPEILVWIESIVERAVKAIFGMEGLFWATIIILVIGMIGLWSPAIGVVMMIAGIIMINYLQLASLGLTTIMGIAVIGIILLWEMKK